MNILSYNPGHDGAVVYIKGGRLIFSIESEKDSHYRYSALSISQVLDAIGEIEELPDVICAGGWWPYDHHEFLFGSLRNSGYRGVSSECSIIQSGRFFNGKVDYFSSTHERSHILCAFGMSTLPKGTPFYALVWEGDIGAFYEIDCEFNITLLGDVLNQPGNRYGLLYGLADPTFPKDGPFPRETDAGKLMALASFSKRGEPTPKEAKLLRFLLDGPFRKLSDYEEISNAPYLNVGLDDPEFRNFAGIYSDAIFEIFHQFARTNLRKGFRPRIVGYAKEFKSYVSDAMDGLLARDVADKFGLVYGHHHPQHLRQAAQSIGYRRQNETLAESLAQRQSRAIEVTQTIDIVGGPGRTRTCNQTVMSGRL